MGVSEQSAGPAPRAWQPGDKEVCLVAKVGVSCQKLLIVAISAAPASWPRWSKACGSSAQTTSTYISSTGPIRGHALQRRPFGHWTTSSRQGKARYVGVSNFRLSQLEECAETLKHRRRAVWLEYVRPADATGKSFHGAPGEHGVGVMAYGSLGYGMLSGTFCPDMRLR